MATDRNYQFNDIRLSMKERAPLTDMTSHKNKSIPSQYFENIWNQGNFVDKTSLKDHPKETSSLVNSTKPSEILSRHSKSQIISQDEVIERLKSLPKQPKSSVSETAKPAEPQKSLPEKRSNSTFYITLIGLIFFGFLVWQLFFFQLTEKPNLNGRPVPRYIEPVKMLLSGNPQLLDHAWNENTDQALPN